MKFNGAIMHFSFVLYLITAVHGQIRYSIPEEMKIGSLIGNIAHDLGLDLKRLRTGRAHIAHGDNIQYAELRTDKGILAVKERIDREQLCGELTPCSFAFEIILENPIDLHQVTVEILDINDNAPTFQKKEIKWEISESAAPGARFLLGGAEDPDVGVNALQRYVLSANEHFVLKQHERPDGVKYAEMVLEKPLDRELRPRLSLALTAVDGGSPQRSGTVAIEVTVLDANDNAPVFNQSLYKSSVPENVPKGTFVIKVSASDADKGSNAYVSYSIPHNNDVFAINESTGDITLSGVLDYEKVKRYELNILGTDGGGLTDSTKVVVDVTDVNDNIPTVAVMSSSKSVEEDALPGTVIAVIKVQDVDSGSNGDVLCYINDDVPFKMKPSSNHIYSLQTAATLDRETTPNYNVTVVACDRGTPSLCNNLNLSIKVTDVNDNTPVFEKKTYTAHIPENNTPGLTLIILKAGDIDCSQNARVNYLLEEGMVNGVSVSTYVSVNGESGVVRAVRSFDYEQMKSFQFRVKAQDGGSPPLSSNVSVDVIIQDQNDNAPQILYPIQSGGSLVAEMVPRAADVGYLVTKVVAVDVDSGQNAWLSYKLQKATDRALFEVGAQNGEIRTARQVTDKDPVKQKLTVVVEDNGQPSRSAIVNVNVAVADSFPEVLSEFTDFTHEKEKNENLTFYLVLALAAVSFLFICCLVVIISVKIYRWRQSRLFYQSSLPVIPYYPPHYADTGRTGTLQQMYNYEVCMTTDSRKSDCKFSRPSSQGVLITDSSASETLQRIQEKERFINDFNSPEQLRLRRAGRRQRDAGGE
uniref:Cadherin domain-containing protein n=1 Tax=Denticeps clupeoides TaxID=299321 RepID=A0AAY4BDK2_9TELE